MLKLWQILQETVLKQDLMEFLLLQQTHVISSTYVVGEVSGRKGKSYWLWNIIDSVRLRYIVGDKLGISP